MAKQYELHLNEKQLNAVKWALELVFRMHLGQMDMAAESLSAMNFRRKISDINDSAAFEKHLQRRRNIELSLDLSYSLAVDEWRRKGLTYYFRTEQSAICEDIWQVINHEQWLNDPERNSWSVFSNEPMRQSHEPLAALKIIDDKEGESSGCASDFV